MKNLRVFLILSLLLLFSCGKEIPEEDVFDNPLDEDEVTYETPALTFYPVDISIDLGSSQTVHVFVLGIENLAGSYVRINYDKVKVSVLSIIVGEFFADAAQAPVFFYDDDAVNGIIEINTSFLGSDSVSRHVHRLADRCRPDLHRDLPPELRHERGDLLLCEDRGGERGPEGAIGLVPIVGQERRAHPPPAAGADLSLIQI